MPPTPTTINPQPRHFTGPEELRYYIHQLHKIKQEIEQALPYKTSPHTATVSLSVSSWNILLELIERRLINTLNSITRS